LILWIIMLCYYSSTYCILLNSLPYNRNARYKYLPCMANTNIQIYSIYKYISLINPYLNYNYWNKLIPRIQTGLELVTCIIWLQVPPFTEAARRLITTSTMPVLTPRLYFRFAHKNNQTVIFFL
jgi:hypothetical protein